MGSGPLVGAVPRYYRRARAVLLALCRPGQHTPVAARWTRTSRPRWGARFIMRPAPGAQARRHHRDGRGQPLPQGGLSAHNARFQVTPEAEGSAFVPFDDILCIQEERTVSNDNTVRYRGLSLQLPPDRQTSRRGSGCTSIRTERSPSSTAPSAWHDTGPQASPSTRQTGRPREPLRRDRPGACGQVDSRSAPDHFPTGQPQQQKRSTHLVHKPVNSKCSRHHRLTS